LYVGALPCQRHLTASVCTEPAHRYAPTHCRCRRQFFVARQNVRSADPTYKLQTAAQLGAQSQCHNSSRLGTESAHVPGLAFRNGSGQAARTPVRQCAELDNLPWPQVGGWPRRSAVPWNFCRAELYAGTPLLGRMQAEGRCRGDYLGWDYRLADPQIQHLFELATKCFYPRNFAAGALANRLQGTRFEIEVCRHFHRNFACTQWQAAGRELSRRLGEDSVATLREIVRETEHGGPGDEAAFVRRLSWRMRDTESITAAAAEDLERQLHRAVGASSRYRRPTAPAGCLE
jgi:hypothetical protein